MGLGESYGLIWVCQCCMITHANGGPCCEDNEDAHKRARDERGRFTSGTVLGDSFPWAELEDGFTVTMGMGREDHEDDCPNRTDDVEYHDCECETDTFSTSQCDGCGSYLYGSRYAFHLWKRAS